MFSPYYFAARQEQGEADPEAFCALNVAVYGPGMDRWVFTEWPRHDVDRSADVYTLGSNKLSWDGNGLTIAIDDEISSRKKRVRGTVCIEPNWVYDREFHLDSAKKHHWQAIAPSSRIEVALEEPHWHFSGSGYFDSNWGDEPLEVGLRRWDWSRYQVNDDTVVFYDAATRIKNAQPIAVRFQKGGEVSLLDPLPPQRTLPKTFLWALPRNTRSEKARPKIRRTWEDTPFYSRTTIESTVDGVLARGVNESLCLERFKTRWMQFMLPYRILKR